MGRALLTDPAREAAWAVMKVLTRDCEGFLIRTVADLVDPKMREPILRWALFLLDEQVLERDQVGHLYMVRVAFEAPPLFRPAVGRFGRSQHRMWRAMRSLRRFGVEELREAAAIEEQPIGREAAQAYVAALAGPGYLVEAERGWRLAPKADTGPRAPIIVQDPDGRAGIFDLNLGRRVLACVNVTASSGRAA